MASTRSVRARLLVLAVLLLGVVSVSWAIGIRTREAASRWVNVRSVQLPSSVPTWVTQKLKGPWYPPIFTDIADGRVLLVEDFNVWTGSALLLRYDAIRKRWLPGLVEVPKHIYPPFADLRMSGNSVWVLEGSLWGARFGRHAKLHRLIRPGRTTAWPAVNVMSKPDRGRVWVAGSDLGDAIPAGRRSRPSAGTRCWALQSRVGGEYRPFVPPYRERRPPSRRVRMDPSGWWSGRIAAVARRVA